MSGAEIRVRGRLVSGTGHAGAEGHAPLQAARVSLASGFAKRPIEPKRKPNLPPLRIAEIVLEDGTRYVSMDGGNFEARERAGS